MKTHQKSIWEVWELPTWGLLIGTYMGFGWLTAYWVHLPFWVILPIGACLMALYNSLQHEVIHGHPTKSIFWNSILAGTPFNLWRPYGIYRETHIQHHKNEIITRTLEDPESYYVHPDQWEKMGAFRKKFQTFFNTFFGRILLGPIYLMVMFLGNEFRQLFQGNTKHLNYWTIQLVACVPVILWLNHFEVPLWQYFFFVIYPGEGLTLIRSFAEHKAAQAVYERIAIVESNFFFSLLFLNNNLHCAHHWKPLVPWYRLPQLFKENRNTILQMNGNYYFKGYTEIMAHYWSKPWIDPLPPEY